MIDINTYIFNKNIDKLLEDTDKYNFTYRVISCKDNIPIEDNYKLIKNIVNKDRRFKGCLYINPKEHGITDIIKKAVNDKEIYMFEFNSFEDGYYPETQSNLTEIFNLIQTTNKPIKVFTGVGARAIPQQWEIWVKKYRDINFIFLHIGCFDYGYSCVDVVKRNENAFAEISNQYELQILRKAFKELGTDKLLLGTSYPYRLTSSAIQMLDNFKFKESEIENILFKNAMKVMKIDEYV